MTGAPVARTALGTLIGLEQDGVAVFWGVPFALPPTGNRRFRRAEALPARSDRHDAARHGPIAPQTAARLVAAMGNYARVQDEDCLTLTIATPAPDEKRRPVMVWLHGGAFTTGAGSLDWYNGSRLARCGDIVVVGINYRLGALGFLCHADIADGNLGIDDQRVALRWVRENIAAFGGDPAHVTLVGQSAGGGAIAALLLDPEGRGLFQRAILQSPMLPQPPVPRAAAEERGNRYLALLDADPRTASVTQILDAQAKLTRAWVGDGAVWPPFAPNVLEAMTAASFTDAIADAAVDKAVLIGWTRDEFGAFFGADPVMQALDADGATTRVKIIAGDASAIEPYRKPGLRPVEWLADFLCDHVFALPSQRFGAALARRGGKAWSYRFDWAPPDTAFKACHCLDLPFIFGNWDGAWRGAPMLAGGDPADIASLSRTMQRAWIDFIRDGDPGWPARGPDEETYMRFDRVCELETRRLPPGTPTYGIV
jgi:para-nitrobenzyl esterase